MEITEYIFINMTATEPLFDMARSEKLHFKIVHMFGSTIYEPCRNENDLPDQFFPFYEAFRSIFSKTTQFNKNI